MATLFIRLQNALKTQENYAKRIGEEVAALPEGSLYCVKQDSRKYYYHSLSIQGVRRKTFLKTRDAESAQLIVDLKRKRYLLHCKKVLEKNVVALRACLLKYEEFDPAEISYRMAASYENITDGQTPANNTTTGKNVGKAKDGDAAQNQQATDWRHAPYNKAMMHMESLKHEAIGGLMVRSKSEALIAFALDLAKVPFHYEEILDLGDKKTAPDFTILHPRTGEKMYWEHFGMMDDSTYAVETYRKLVLYGQNGIVPGKNLIYTMETNEEPLSISEVQRLVTYYFSW